MVGTHVPTFDLTTTLNYFHYDLCISIWRIKYTRQPSVLSSVLRLITQFTLAYLLILGSVSSLLAFYIMCITLHFRDHLVG